MYKFKLFSNFKPRGDQPKAIRELMKGLHQGLKNQVLLGVTGSGKTFTLANVIAKINLPTLVISHNKTLAAQLFQEFREFFPENAVSYFVSYYDYYQPEAYIPQTDTYIAKETDINTEIDKLRLQATSNLLSRKDTLIVASVSCIYNLGSPQTYGTSSLQLTPNINIDREDLLKKLLHLQYSRGSFELKRGNFRVRGDIVDIFPAYSNYALRIEFRGNRIHLINKIDPVTAQVVEAIKENISIFPAKHYMLAPNKLHQVLKKIKLDLENEVKQLKSQNKLVEAQRLFQRVNYDLEMIGEFGYVNGIENYSRYFDGRRPGDPPFTLLDYFCYQYQDNWLLIIDESHITIPQIRGMYRGDIARKKTLIEYGFRLLAALDNRPLRFNEFLARIPQTIFVSATPGNWELKRANKIVEQLVRPTGLVDPGIEIRPTKNQIPDLIYEIVSRKSRSERVLVTTLTKRIAEDLTYFLNSPQKINKLLKNRQPKESAGKFPRVQYLHADIDTLKRQDILEELRRGKYDVIVGINLLREGLDLPEVSLVAILDADKEGFLRSATSLIQTMGRAARHINGKVIMYADRVTQSMKNALEEVNRRRKIQLEYNRRHGIIPKSVVKPIRNKLVLKPTKAKLNEKDPEISEYYQLLPLERKQLIKKYKFLMRKAAKELDFEKAALLRDRIKALSDNG